LPEVAAVSGSNHVEVGFALADDADDGKRTVSCFAVTDNLIKGGAGQAIQSMNLMLGLDERLTLEDPGAWP
jgi:N-acetyl-gamma-glutamyl-phosphate reductase